MDQLNETNYIIFLELERREDERKHKDRKEKDASIGKSKKNIILEKLN